VALPTAPGGCAGHPRARLLLHRAALRPPPPAGPAAFMTPPEAASLAELHGELAEVLQGYRFSEALRAAVRWAGRRGGPCGGDMGS
jgi:hypothetical protein